MIEIKRTEHNTVKTIIKGKGVDVAEELLNGSVSVITSLIRNDLLDESKLELFMYDFAEQIIKGVKEVSKQHD